MELGWTLPPQGNHSTNSGRRERVPACEPADTARTRERVNATTYRCRSGITTTGPLREGSMPERACHTSQEDPGESVKTSWIGETRTFHDVRSRSDLGRIRSISRAKSRREAEGAATGASEVERARDGAREDNAPLLTSSIPRSAHGVVKRRPHRSLSLAFGRGVSKGVTGGRP